MRSTRSTVFVVFRLKRRSTKGIRATSMALRELAKAMPTLRIRMPG